MCSNRLPNDRKFHSRRFMRAIKGKKHLVHARDLRNFKTSVRSGPFYPSSSLQAFIANPSYCGVSLVAIALRCSYNDSALRICIRYSVPISAVVPFRQFVPAQVTSPHRLLLESLLNRKFHRGAETRPNTLSRREPLSHVRTR